MKIRKATKKDFGEIAEIIKNEYGKPPYNEKWT
jgi:N-acetylglutamate synthase-like GNAT family acetyltransferase